MFSVFSVLVTSLRPAKASVPIASREDLVCTSSGCAGSNKLARLRRLWADATGTGHTSQQLEPPSIPSVNQGRSPASRSSNPLTDSTRRPPLAVHLSRIECYSSAISPGIAPLSSVEQVTINPQPYFVPSTASASEILTNVAIQDLLAQDAESYDLLYQPTNIPILTSVSDSWDSWDSFEFDFVNPFARDDYPDSDCEAGEEEIIDHILQSPPKPIDSQFRDLHTAPLPSLVHINRETQLISSSVIEVTLDNTCLPREDHGDGEEPIIIPVTPFPHPHLLSPIAEEYEDETSDTETIRPSTSISACLRVAGID